MADYTPIEDALLDLKDSMQAFLEQTANGGDVADLAELVRDVDFNATELTHAVRDTKDRTYRGWLETDPLPTPPHA